MCLLRGSLWFWGRLVGGGKHHGLLQDTSGPGVEVCPAVGDGVVLDIIFWGLWFYRFDPFSYGHIVGAGDGRCGGRVCQAHQVLGLSSLLRDVHAAALSQHLVVDGSEMYVFRVRDIVFAYVFVNLRPFFFLGFFNESLTTTICVCCDPGSDVVFRRRFATVRRRSVCGDTSTRPGMFSRVG